jgi:hypothetical protein
MTNAAVCGGDIMRETVKQYVEPTSSISSLTTCSSIFRNLASRKAKLASAS